MNDDHRPRRARRVRCPECGRHLDLSADWVTEDHPRFHEPGSAVGAPASCGSGHRFWVLLAGMGAPLRLVVVFEPDTFSRSAPGGPGRASAPG